MYYDSLVKVIITYRRVEKDELRIQELEEKKFCRYFSLLEQRTIIFITSKVDGMVFEICNINLTVHILIKVILYRKNCVITSVFVYKIKGSQICEI